jgi:hypothetical protein
MERPMPQPVPLERGKYYHIYNRGLAYRDKGDTARAIADCDQALKFKRT